jgi:HEAT repeat protein
VRRAALQGLAFLEDSRALEALLVAARHAEPATRGAAMRALGHCSSEVRVQSALLRGLDDSDAWVRYHAAQSLGRLQCEVAAGKLAELLSDPAGQVHVGAVEALSHLTSETAFRALCGAAESEDQDVRRAALVGLGLSGRREAIEVLVAAGQAEQAATRLVAVSGLAGFQEPTAVDALGRAASDDDESVRVAAIGFLAAQRSTYASEVLIGLLRDTPEPDRVIAALSAPSDARVHAILSALNAADDELAQRLTSALARMHRREGTQALIAALAITNVAARRAAATTLAATRIEEGMLAVKRASTEDPDPEVRRVCSLLLAQ